MANDSDGGSGGGVSAAVVKQLALAIRSLNQSVRSIRNRLGQLAPILFNLGDAARQLLRNPVKFILSTVVGFVVTVFIEPVFGGIVAVGTDIVLAIRFFFVSLTSAFTLFSSAILGAAGRLGSDVLLFIGEWNQAVARLVAEAGLGALPIATGLWLVEGIVIGYGVLLLAQTVASAVGLGRLAGGIRAVIAGVIP